MKKLYAKILIFLIIQPVLAQEKIAFDSANPFNFRDVIVNLDKQESQAVFGILNLPETSPKNMKTPLIIAFAGSKGWAEHHLDTFRCIMKWGLLHLKLRASKAEM